MPTGLLSLLFGIALQLRVALGAAVTHVNPRDAVPRLTYDPNTTRYCTWWVDLTSPVACSTILSDNTITLETFRRWNPSVPENCATLQGARSYCVEAMFEPAPEPTTMSTKTTAHTVTTLPPTTTSTKTTATSPPTTTTSTIPGNGVSTPAPTQPGMISNCNKFHFVQQGQTCVTIAALYSISQAQFIQWNPAAGSDCSGLWASTYACVGVIGGTPTPSTTTKPGNGIATPTPAHPGMISNCNKFAYVNPGDTCDAIAFWNGVGGQWIKLWNGIEEACRSLQAHTYVCVGLIAGNGIPTPTPAHPGMANNCNKFAYVNPGDTCDGIGFWNGVGGQWIKLWNGIEESCRSIQANTYVCVGVI